jgi:outer membrane protein
MMRRRARSAPGLLLAVAGAAVLVLAGPGLAQPDGRGLSLEECIDIALSTHPGLYVAQKTVDVAKTRIGSAELVDNGYVAISADAATSLPLASIEVSDGAGGTNKITLGSPVTGTAGVAFRQPLLAGRQKRAGKHAAEEGVLAAEAQQEKTAHDIILGVKQAYYGVLTTMEVRDVADEAVMRARDHMRVAEARRDVGEAADLDVMQAQVELDQRQHDLMTAEGAYATAIAGLNTAMGIDVNTPTTTTSPGELVGRTVEFDPIYGIAERARPEVHSLDHQVEAARFELKRTKTLDDASLELSGGYTYNAGALFTQGSTYQAGLALTIPLFDGGVTRSQKRTAEENLGLLEAQRPLLLQSIALEVKQAVVNLSTALDQLTSTSRAVETAREAHRVAELAYENGVGSQINARDAQLTLLQAQLNHAQSTYNYRVALAQVAYAAGVRELGEISDERAGDER